MNKKFSIILVVMTAMGINFTNSYAAEPKLAQTGFQFLSVVTEARAAAMGEAFTAVAARSNSVFYNPANIARMNSRIDFALSTNKWIADIRYFGGALAFNPNHGVYGSFTINMLFVDYGDFQGTVVNPDVEKGYSNTEIFTPSSYCIGLAYSKMLSDRFAFGINVKYAQQSLGNSIIPDQADPYNFDAASTKKNRQDVIAFDFGTIYLTGFKSLAFAMSVRNFASEVKYEEEGFQLPLVFNIGLAMNILDLTSLDPGRHSFLLTVDATHPRAAPEQIKVGGEYTLLGVLALRAGYLHNFDERGITAGFGLMKDFGRSGGRVALDYAYTPFGVFDNVQRFSFSISL